MIQAPQGDRSKSNLFWLTDAQMARLELFFPKIGPAPVSFRSFESDTRHQGDWIWQRYSAKRSTATSAREVTVPRTDGCRSLRLHDRQKHALDDQCSSQDGTPAFSERGLLDDTAKGTRAADGLWRSAMVLATWAASAATPRKRPEPQVWSQPSPKKKMPA